MHTGSSPTSTFVRSGKKARAARLCLEGRATPLRLRATSQAGAPWRCHSEPPHLKKLVKALSRLYRGRVFQIHTHFCESISCPKHFCATHFMCDKSTLFCARHFLCDTFYVRDIIYTRYFLCEIFYKRHFLCATLSLFGTFSCGTFFAVFCATLFSATHFPCDIFCVRHFVLCDILFRET